MANIAIIYGVVFCHHHCCHIDNFEYEATFVVINANDPQIHIITMCTVYTINKMNDGGIEKE